MYHASLNFLLLQLKLATEACFFPELATKENNKNQKNDK